MKTNIERLLGLVNKIDEMNHECKPVLNAICAEMLAELNQRLRIVPLEAEKLDGNGNWVPCGESPHSIFCVKPAQEQGYPIGIVQTFTISVKYGFLETELIDYEPLDPDEEDFIDTILERYDTENDDADPVFERFYINNYKELVKYWYAVEEVKQ
jgi:hypothetical protein